MEVQEVILRMNNNLPIAIRRNRSHTISCTLTDDTGLKELMEKLRSEETPEQKEQQRRYEEAVKQFEECVWAELEAMPHAPLDPVGNPVTRKTHRIEWDHISTGNYDDRTGLELFASHPYIEPIKSEYDDL